jgi:hypothetical protein
LDLLIDDEASEVGSLRAHKKPTDDGSAGAQLSAADIEKALQHLMGLQFTVSPQRKSPGGSDDDNDDDDDDNDDDDDEEEPTASPGEVHPGASETVEYGAAAFKEQLRDTAELDLGALVAEQRQTIEEQRATIAQLEARVKVLEERLARQQPPTKK